MNEISQERKDWLLGAYLDRITETALELKKRITHPIVSNVEKEAAEKLVGEYAYLIELTAGDQAFLEDETVRELLSRLRDDRDYKLRKAYGREILQASVGFHMKSADAAYHFDESAFDEAMNVAFGGLPVTDDDRAIMRDIVLRYVWPRLRQAHENLRKSTFDHLRALNPETISPRAEFAMDIGWAVLVNKAAARIDTYPAEWRAKIVGGKEKLGCCVLHIDCDYGQRGCRSEVERLREEIRLRSIATCEICGEAGRLRLSGYAKTVCTTHVGVLGELREDDGRWADPYRWHEDEDGDEYPAESAELLRDLKPVRPRPKDHVVDLMPETDIERQIENDIDTNYGRKADLLLEFCGAIEIAVVAAMSVADDDVDFWLRSEVDKWHGAQPLSDDDREFLRRYLRSLAIDERGRRQRREEGWKPCSDSSVTSDSRTKPIGSKAASASCWRRTLETLLIPPAALP